MSMAIIGTKNTGGSPMHTFNGIFLEAHSFYERDITTLSFPGDITSTESLRLVVDEILTVSSVPHQ